MQNGALRPPPPPPSQLRSPSPHPNEKVYYMSLAASILPIPLYQRTVSLTKKLYMAEKSQMGGGESANKTVPRRADRQSQVGTVNSTYISIYSPILPEALSADEAA
jgi:hypothetical protein